MSIDRLQPVVTPAVFTARSAATGIPPSRAGSAAGPLEKLSDDAFHLALQKATADATGAAAAQVATEAVRRLGRLQVRDLRLLLLDAPDTPVWAQARRRSLTAVAATPALAPSIISMHAQLLRLPSATVREGQESGNEPSFVAQATLDVGGREITGSIQRARTRKGARQQAMASLVASLAGLDDPFAQHSVASWTGQSAEPASQDPATRTGPGPGGGRSPISVLNEYAQAGHITRPDFRVTLHSPTTFTATVTATLGEQQLTGNGAGSSKQAARAGAADDLLDVVQRALAADLPEVPATEPEPEPAPVPGPAPAALPLPPATLQDPPPVPAASAQELFQARDVVDHLLAGGTALTLLPSRHPARTAWMLFSPDGTPPARAATLPAPLQYVTRELVLAGPGGIMPRRATVTGVAAPLGLVLPAVLASRDAEHPSATGWRHAVRLGLRCVAQQRVHPALTVEGHDCWRVGPSSDALRRAVADAAARLAPEGHCLLAGTTPVRMAAPEPAVWAALDAVADAMLRTPGATTVLGPGPYSGPAHDIRPTPQLWTWADGIEDGLDPRPAPGLVLRIKQPENEGPVPAAPLTLYLDAGDGRDPVSAAGVWAGQSHPGLTTAALPAVRRVLRRATRLFPPLADLAAQDHPSSTTLSAHDLAHLHQAAAGPLAELGVGVHWPPHLTDVLTSTAVVGAAHEDDDDHDAPASGGYLSLERLVDCRWHINLDGEPLTDAEMTALADAAAPLIQLRGRWLLIDPETTRRARDRRLAPLPSLDALAAALSGTLILGGETLHARPAGTLAALVDALHQAPDSPQPIPAPAGLTGTLRHYQERALAWLSHTLGLGFGALLADDMGLGKTLTTIALHLHRAESTERAGPTLVVCPASLMTNWQREIARFAPGTTVVRYHGADRTLGADAQGRNSVVVTTYGTLRRDTQALAATTWGLVVADEAQHIKNPASATAKALRDLPAAARLAVTGTPAENNLTELWSILDWTNPGLFGTRAAFRARYGAVEKDPGVPAAAQLARLIGPFMMRRRKSDPGIAPELPDKVHHHRIVALTDEQTGLYEATVRDTMERIAASTGIERRGQVLKLLQALRQICNTPALYLKEPLGEADPAALVRRSGKLAALDDLLPSLAERSEAGLIFTGYVQMGRILEHHLRARGHRAIYFLHGGTPPARRQDLVDAFQNDSEPAPLFILSVKAAGTGLNLTRAEHVIHYDRPWNPAVEDQATDRAHRIGQHRTVQVHHLITEGTVEDHINELLARKRALTDSVLTSGESALAELDDTELAALVTLGSR
ncbi:SNF2-related protein [Actinacidiphila sp. ITFR-21]|uniref:SNF2-related protein n=1 Tax=Actinacidiphila sp. ITFR-21 TaxID=3075199 RepID=UPI00288B29B3|nr:SNF2-related protein [Streptomyces sp. ITFR-21]WNI20004.1 SNF2-related protein [Streptomyces sp. ITFR-21]